MAATGLRRIQGYALVGGYSRYRPTATDTVGDQLLRLMIGLSYDRGRDVVYLYEF
jgi:hypothetical protein